MSKSVFFNMGFTPLLNHHHFFAPLVYWHIGYHMFFWGSEPNSKVFLIFIEGFPIPSHVWEYPKYRVMPDISGQGCAGRPFIPRGGAGRGKGKNPRGGAGRGWAGRGEGENPRGGSKKRKMDQTDLYFSWRLISYFSALIWTNLTTALLDRVIISY